MASGNTTGKIEIKDIVDIVKRAGMAGSKKGYNFEAWAKKALGPVIGQTLSSAGKAYLSDCANEFSYEGTPLPPKGEATQQMQKYVVEDPADAPIQPDVLPLVPAQPQPPAGEEVSVENITPDEFGEGDTRIMGPRPSGTPSPVDPDASSLQEHTFDHNNQPDLPEGKPASEEATQVFSSDEFSEPKKSDDKVDSELKTPTHGSPVVKAEPESEESLEQRLRENLAVEKNNATNHDFNIYVLSDSMYDCLLEVHKLNKREDESPGNKEKRANAKIFYNRLKKVNTAELDLGLDIETWNQFEMLVHDISLMKQDPEKKDEPYEQLVQRKMQEIIPERYPNLEKIAIKCGLYADKGDDFQARKKREKEKHMVDGKDKDGNLVRCLGFKEHEARAEMIMRLKNKVIVENKSRQNKNKPEIIMPPDEWIEEQVTHLLIHQSQVKYIPLENGGIIPQIPETAVNDYVDRMYDCHVKALCSIDERSLEAVSSTPRPNPIPGAVLVPSRLTSVYSDNTAKDEPKMVSFEDAVKTIMKSYFYPEAIISKTGESRKLGMGWVSSPQKDGKIREEVINWFNMDDEEDQSRSIVEKYFPKGPAGKKADEADMNVIMEKIDSSPKMHYVNHTIRDSEKLFISIYNAISLKGKGNNSMKGYLKRLFKRCKGYSPSTVSVFTQYASDCFNSGEKDELAKVVQIPEDLEALLRPIEGGVVGPAKRARDLAKGYENPGFWSGSFSPKNLGRALLGIGTLGLSEVAGYLLRLKNAKPAKLPEAGVVLSKDTSSAQTYNKPQEGSEEQLPSDLHSEYSSDAQTEDEDKGYKLNPEGTTCLVPDVSAVPEGCDATLEQLFKSVSEGFMDTKPEYVREVFELSKRLPVIKADFDTSDNMKLIIGLDCDGNNLLYRQLASERAGSDQ